MDRLYKILIIDDDEYSADNLCLELKRYGQLVVEGIARNGSNGKKMIDKLRPDLISRCRVARHERNRTVRANQQLCHVEYASDFLYCLRQIYD